MSRLLNATIGVMREKRLANFKQANKQATQQSQTSIAQITGFDASTGTYTATTPDGGEVPVKLGNFGAPPSQVAIVTTQGSTVQFADFRAPQ